MNKRSSIPYPIFSSFDIRDSGFKVAQVDANIFPAGFNNICSTDVEHAAGLFDRYLKDHYAKDIRKILLVTEEHTQNTYYWDNVGTLSDILKASGRGNHHRFSETFGHADRGEQHDSTKIRCPVRRH